MTTGPYAMHAPGGAELVGQAAEEAMMIRSIGSSVVVRYWNEDSERYCHRMRGSGDW